MLSRVADSIFWMSRYIERAENVARFIDVNLHLTLGLAQRLRQSVGAAGHHDRRSRELYRALRRRHAEERDRLPDVRQGESELDRLLPARGARERPHRARDHLLGDVGGAEQVLPDGARRVARLVDGRRPTTSSTRSSRSSHLLDGITDATMSHGEAWHFARMGRLLERADKTSRILDVKYFILLPSDPRRRHAARYDPMGGAA